MPLMGMALVWCMAVTTPATAQTFLQLSDMGSNIGPRLTRIVARNRVAADLFGDLGGNVSYVDAVASPPVAYEFASDPAWNRILFGQNGDYVNQFRNDANGGLSGPLGLDVSPQGTVFVADGFSLRFVVLSFDAASRALSFLASGERAGVTGMPVDIAWDGLLGPLAGSNAFFYVLDHVGHVSYWRWTPPSTATFQWVYGSPGTGTGQFTTPRGVCVGHALSTAGGTVFTSDLYVADAGNHRLIWLRRGTSGATWQRAVTLDLGGVPADCSVDNFGNVYVVDEQNSRILKYTASLEFLASYGTYGRGATNLNTFSHPHAIHVVYGRRLLNGQPNYYGEGRIITAEDWTDSSGATEHWLGVRVIQAIGWGGPFGASVDYRITDHATVAIDVLRGGLLYKNVSVTFNPAGSASGFWDATDPSGNPAPAGTYQLRVTATSAYGCDGSTWCQSSLASNVFFAGCSGGPEGCIHPEERNVALGPLEPGGDNGLPTTFFLHQLVSSYIGPIARRSAVSAAGAAGSWGVAPGGLAAEVRAAGLLALSVGVPSSSAAVPVSIRVYALNGVPVRELAANPMLQPGEYLVGWDARDRDGRAVQPGVYIAVMTAGSFRGVQRLIVPRR
jgi:flagellar hook assembly protein FlgD